MPNWKKLIVSGSDASLNSLNVTNNVTAQSFTGSFSGSLTAPGATTQVVYNNGGILAANSGFVYSGSNVGIGTTNPSYKLNVYESNTAEYISAKFQTTHPNLNYILLQNGGGSFNHYIQTNSGTLGLSADENGSSGVIQLKTNNVIAVTVNTSQNVGIGTTSPATKLDLVGSYKQTQASGGVGLYHITTPNADQVQGVWDLYTDTAVTPDFFGRFGFKFEGGASNTYRQFQVHVGDATTPKLIVNGSGNVGIGTTNPSEKLTIGNGNIVISGSDSTNYLIGVKSLNSNNDINGGLEVYQINGWGSKVGIKTGRANGGWGGQYALYSETVDDANLSYPSQSAHTKFNSKTTASYGPAVVYIDSGSGGTIPSIHTYNGAAFAINTGSVGIGTTTPAAVLHTLGTGIVNIVQSSDSVSYTQYYNTSTGGGGTSDGFTVGNNGLTAYVWQRESADLLLGTSNTEALRITSTGNVGIGTSSPASILHVEAGSPTTNLIASSGNGFLRIADSATSATRKEFTILLDNTNNRVDIQAIQQGVAARNITLNASGGNVGIGTTSPSAKLQVKGDGGTTGITFQTTDSSNNQNLYVLDGGRAGINYYPFMIAHSSSVAPTGDPYLQVATSALYVSQSGNVGIGTASPTAKLEVNGNVKATSFTGSFSGSVSAPGSTTQIVYNDNGVLAANSGLVYSGSNVGIGISSPTEKLHIVSSAAGNQFARITATDSNASAAWVAQNDSGDNIVYRVFSSGVSGTQMGAALGRSASLLANLGGSGVFLLGTFSNTDFILGTNNTENMRITTAGNVGIGTTLPTSKLDVRGTLTVSGSGANVDIKSSTTTSTLNIYGSDTSTNCLGVGILSDNVTRWRAGMVDSRKYQIAYADGSGGFTPTAAMTIVSGSGNVGIGTVNPSAKLHVGGGEIRVDAGQAITLDIANSMYLVGASNQLRLYNGGNPVVNITTGGNVGIGTTSPSEKLHVVGDVLISDSSPSLIFTDTTNNADAIIYTLDDGSLAFSADENNEVAGSKLLFYVDGGEKVRITDGGNVGIGTASPSQKLSVVGAVSASTYYGDGSNLTGIGSGSVAAAGSDGQLQYNNSGLFGGATRLIYNDTTNKVGIGTSSPGYDLDVSGSVRVQDKLRVGPINTGNGVIHQSSDATINASSSTIVWSVPGSSGAVAFIEYYIINTVTSTSQRGGNIVVTWNSAGTPQITHTETTTPDIGTTALVTFTTSMALGGDPQLVATNTSINPFYIVLNYRYF